jgi:hypothetical protein
MTDDSETIAMRVTVIGKLGCLLWPTSNKTCVPASEPRISIYVWRNVALALTAGAGYIS